MWDIMNEPDYPQVPIERVVRNFENCKFMSKTFHKLDPNTPVTIGMAFVDGMIDLADYVDVLQFHDYMQTRGEIRDTIKRAKEFAAKVNKPLINGEMGCIARANPYDITLQEHMNAHVGWYIWELMIVKQGWGTFMEYFMETGVLGIRQLLPQLWDTSANGLRIYFQLKLIGKDGLEEFWIEVISGLRILKRTGMMDLILLRPLLIYWKQENWLQ